MPQAEMRAAQGAVDERANVMHEMRGLVKRAREEGKEKAAEIKEAFDRCKARILELNADEERNLEVDRMAREVNEFEIEERTPARAPIRADLGRRETGFQRRQKEIETRAMDAMHDLQHIGLGYVRGRAELDAQDLKALETLEKRAFGKWLCGHRVESMTEAEQRALSHGAIEPRALSHGDFEQGGSLAAPPSFGKEVKIKLDQALPFRAACSHVEGELGTSWGVPTIEEDPEDPDWTSELGEVDEDTAMRTGGRQLHMHDLTKLIKLSLRIIRNSPHDVVGIVMDRLARKVAVAQSRALMTGSGVGEPLGVFTPNANGIPTTRDVTTGFAVNALSIEGFKRIVGSVDPQWHPGSVFLMHHLITTELWILEDGEGHSFWQPSVVAGKPSTFLSFPVMVEKDAPSTLVAGAYFTVFGNPSQYQVLDLMMPEVFRYLEKYRNKRQIGYQIEDGGDGMPIWKEAFARGQIPA